MQEKVHTIERRAEFRFTRRVPNRNPLPESEVAICRRLRKFRESLRLSRVAMADELEADLTTLATYEHCRAPVRFRIARRLFDVFGVNPAWLFDGSGKVLYGSNLPTMPSKFDDLRFSDVYTEKLAGLLKRGGKVRPGDSEAGVSERGFVWFDESEAGRNAASEWLAKSVRKWFAELPVELVSAFFNDMDAFAEGWIERQIGQGAPPQVGLLRQAKIDLSNPLANSPPMPDKSGFWKDLQARAIKATAQRGKKAELARHLGVKRQSVHLWLKPEGETLPSTNNVLRLLEWVEAEERQSNPARRQSGEQNEEAEQARRGDGKRKGGKWG